MLPTTPLVFADDEAVLHGGNFYGQDIAFAADTLQLAIIKLALHAERCLARLCDPLMNNGLPAFLQGGPIGRTAAAQLLMPLADDGDMSDLYKLLGSVAPDLQ